MDFVIRCETEPSASDRAGNMVMLTMRSDGETISWDYTWPENLVQYPEDVTRLGSDHDSPLVSVRLLL
jgi:hypothetical protein